MGSDPIALPLLRHLAERQGADQSLVNVFTQPDRPTGRGMNVRPNAIKAWAREAGVEVRQPEKFGLEEGRYLRERSIDLVLVMAYGQILPGPLLDLPEMLVLNFHASLLPRLRGASPVHTAIALGLPETGVSLMRIVRRLDAGPVADQERVRIAPSDKAPDLLSRLGEACVPLLERALPRLGAGTLAFREQDLAAVSYCRIIEKTDAHLDFTAPAVSLARRIRAFTPWPGSVFPYEGQDLRILEAHAAEGEDGRTPGTLLADADGLRIACGEGSLRVLRLQRPGGKPLEAEAFLRGFPLASERLLESRPMRPLESPVPFPYRRKTNSGPAKT